MPRAAKHKPRRRLDADTARALILDVTEKRLVVGGPAGIRLQEVAADAGVSHPTILHHFGSRELLVKAVIERAIGRINATLVAAIGSAGGDRKKLEDTFEDVAQALEREGHGRVVLWLALEGHHLDAEGVRLSDVAGAIHALRLSRAKEKPSPKDSPKRLQKRDREDTARVVVLATLALVADSVVTSTLLEEAGLDGNSRPAFRSWLARLLLDHMEA